MNNNVNELKMILFLSLTPIFKSLILNLLYEPLSTTKNIRRGPLIYLQLRKLSGVGIKIFELNSPLVASRLGQIWIL